MTAHDLVGRLRADILSGTFPPGEELQQIPLAQRYGVSRIPVRDALAVLAAEKLVEVVPNRGARVVRLSREELAEVYDLRLMLESACIAEAALRVTPEDLAEIDYVLRRSNLEAGRPGWWAGDWDFHEALYRPAGKPRHLAMIHELRQSCRVQAVGYDDLAAFTPDWLDDHAALAAALAEHDPELCRAVLTTHLEGARDALLARMD